MSTINKGPAGGGTPTGPKEAQFGRLADDHSKGRGAPIQSDYVSADVLRKRLVGAAEDIGHYLDIVMSSAAVRDDRMLSRAFKMMLIAVRDSVEKSEALIEAAARDERLGEFCRSAADRSAHHG